MINEFINHNFFLKFNIDLFADFQNLMNIVVIQS